ncbi:type II toxin-antitoxin system ParD family antitoxin [Roseomonas stagni]|uniref:Type II toxin-antitoxin system ParD family antitoxin n=1 Tax=Falsiroseomonas algicola TaxID=2716930 RepID=A0A6M1LVM8_9PROT|nr:type II toxin-antitoxin system ParD family antitoxin [Falsiroseomonas algicola]NGM23524.1 type II toxin-antitoxin system ParD family antitoxin [Falsiroseomonas algicola]
MTITLSPDLVALIEEKIASGRFPSAEAVVREALIQLDAAEASLAEDDEAWLKQAYEEGIASGEPIEVDLDNLRDHVLNGAPLRRL